MRRLKIATMIVAHFEFNEEITSLANFIIYLNKQRIAYLARPTRVRQWASRVTTT